MKQGIEDGQVIQAFLISCSDQAYIFISRKRVDKLRPVALLHAVNIGSGKVYHQPRRSVLKPPSTPIT